MATARPRQSAFNRVEADRRVRHPLHAIRSRIFWYVLIEGTALAVLLAAACFWLGLGVDYFTWATFSFDWLYAFDEASGTGSTLLLRLTILAIAVGCVAAVITFKIVRRLFKEFSDPAVALLLERQYPNDLGDRLITAVELADPKLSQQYGYSQAMVDATIRDAAERVENLPVHEIFRWGRLKLLVAGAVFATLGAYLMVGVAWCVWYQRPPLEFAVRFHHTASIWAERNLLLMNSYWPPNTFIELIRFPGHELKVPREEDRPDVKVRWIRWAIADSGDDAPRGWRALRFSDLESLLPSKMLDIRLPAEWDGWLVDLDDLDQKVPVGTIPREWGWQHATSGHVKRELAKPEVQQALDASTREAVYDLLKWRYWTIDNIELQLRYTDAKAKTKPAEGALAGAAGEAAIAHFREKPVAAAMSVKHKADYDKLLAILAKLEELAEDPGMERVLRKMDEPSQVVAQRKTKNGSGSTNCTPVGSHKLLFPLGELKESCEFSIAADDYWTPWRQITLVPPPIMDQLQIDKEEPAYLYYRMLENPKLLKNYRQRISSVSVSANGPYSKILVPFGTNVFLTGHSDRVLKDIRVAEPDAKNREEKISITPPTVVKLANDQQTFTCSFNEVQRIVEFDLEFKDQYGVRGTRRVIIMPVEDQAPRIHELGLAVLPRLFQPSEESSRGIGGGPRYIITPDAFLKLRGKIEDDHGLAKLDYKYEVQEIEYQNIFADTADGKSSEPSSQQARKAQRGTGPDIVTGGLQYVPGPSSYALFATTYYGALANVVKDGSLPPPPPRTGLVALERAKQRLTKKYSWDVTPEELTRLVTIQPANRKLLLDVLELTAEKRALTGIAEELKEANQTTGFLGEVMDFAGLPAEGNERAALTALASSDAAESLARLLLRLKSDPVKLAADRELLQKEPEKTILTHYNLQDEDGAFGFDLREYMGFVKALGSTEVQKHYALRLSVTATDNNIYNGPGTTNATLQYGFLIVSENELLTLLMKEQRKYHSLLYSAVQEMEKTRQSLESQLGEYRQNGVDPTKLLLRAEAARKSLRDGGVAAKAISGKYEGMLLEMEFNRMKRDRIDKVKNRVADPLAAITASDGDFPKTSDLAAKLCKELGPDADKKDKADQEQKGDDPVLLKQLLANKDRHAKNAETVVADATELIWKLNKILDAMQDVVNDDEMIERLVVIEQGHRAVDQFIRTFETQWRLWLREQLFGGGGKKGGL